MNIYSIKQYFRFKGKQRFCFSLFLLLSNFETMAENDLFECHCEKLLLVYQLPGRGLLIGGLFWLSLHQLGKCFTILTWID